jgi:thioredoxin-related protein
MQRQEPAMRHPLTISLLISTLLFPLRASADWESAILPRDFKTESTLAKALTVARDTDRQVIVYYTRTNCPPCTVLQARLRKDAVAKPFRESYVFTAVWGSSMGHAEREEYRSRYGVQGAPTWLVFTREGKYVCTSGEGFESDDGAVALHRAAQVLLAAQTEPAASGPRRCL